MKKILPLLLLSSCALFAIKPYQAFYIDGGMGLELKDKIDTKTSTLTYQDPYNWYVGIGYQYKNYRVELEQISSYGDLYSLSQVRASGDLTKSTQMLNLYYSAYNHSKMVLNLGAGAGISETKLTNMVQNGVKVEDLKDTNSPSINAIISLGYFISDRLSTTIKYRYLYTFDGDNFDANSQTNVSLGLRIDF